MNPYLQRVITILAGALGAWIATRPALAPYISPSDAKELATALFFGSVGWAFQHPADWKPALPSVAIVQYPDVMKAGGQPVEPQPAEKPKGA